MHEILIFTRYLFCQRIPPNTRPVNNDRPCSLKRPDFRAYARKVGCGCEPPRRSLMGRRDGFAFAGGVFASDCDGLLIHVLECVAQYAAVVDIMLVCPGVEPSGDGDVLTYGLAAVFGGVRVHVERDHAD